MSLRIVDRGTDRTVTLDQLSAQIGGGGGGRGAARTTQRLTYLTQTVSPTVYVTVLAPNGVTVLVSRRTTGVTLVGALWGYDLAITAGMTDVIAVWDEGDVLDYVTEWVVIDT